MGYGHRFWRWFLELLSPSFRRAEASSTSARSEEKKVRKSHRKFERGERKEYRGEEQERIAEGNLSEITRILDAADREWQAATERLELAQRQNPAAAVAALESYQEISAKFWSLEGKLIKGVKHLLSLIEKEERTIRKATKTLRAAIRDEKNVIASEGVLADSLPDERVPAEAVIKDQRAEANDDMKMLKLEQWKLQNAQEVTRALLHGLNQLYADAAQIQASAAERLVQALKRHDHDLELLRQLLLKAQRLVVQEARFTQKERQIASRDVKKDKEALKVVKIETGQVRDDEEAYRDDRAA